MLKVTNNMSHIYQVMQTGQQGLAEGKTKLAGYYLLEIITYIYRG